MRSFHSSDDMFLPREINQEKKWPLWASALVGAGLAIIFAAFLLIAHLEYVEMTTTQVFCWDFAAGEKWIETECNKALAYDN